MLYSQYSGKGVICMNNDTILALSVAICALLAGIALARIVHSEAAKNILGKVINFVIVLLGIVGGVMGIIFLFMSLFEGAFLISLILAVVFFAIPYLIGKMIQRSSFESRLGDNPIFNEALQYCKDNNICGIKLTAETISFYNSLPNVQYLEDTVTETKVEGKKELESYVMPYYITQYANYCACRNISFAQMGYSSLDRSKIEYFAKRLAKGLDGYEVCRHYIARYYIEYHGSTSPTGFTYNSSTGRGTATYGDFTEEHHRTVICDDYFVYKKEIKDKMKQQEKASEPKSSNLKSW